MKLIIIVAIYTLLYYLLHKLFKVEKRQKGIFGKYEHLDERIEKIEKYILYIFLVLIGINIFIVFAENPFHLLWLYFGILWLLRGFEEWKYNKQSNEYIVNWFSSVYFFGIACWLFFANI